MKKLHIYALLDANDKIISLHETEKGAHENLVNHIYLEDGLRIENPVIHK